MSISKKIFPLLLIAFLFNFGCGHQEKQQETGKVKDITVLQLKEQMAADPGLVILDVRTREELTGELPKIERAINIPLQELETRINELEPLKDKKIAVICRSGHRSSIACGILLKKDYKVENVLGGMKAYLGK